MSFEVEVTPDLEDAAPFSRWLHGPNVWICGGTGPGWFEQSHTLGVLPPASDRVEFEVQTYWPMYPDRIPLCRRRISTPIRQVDAIDDVTQPIASPEIDQVMRDGTGVSVSARYPGVCWVEMQSSVAEALRQTTLAVRFAVIGSGQTIATGVYRWDAAELWRKGGSVVLDGDIAAVTANPDVRWAVVLSSDPVLALADFESNRHWSGSVELPLIVKR